MTISSFISEDTEAPLTLIISGMGEMLFVSLVTIEISSQNPNGCSAYK